MNAFTALTTKMGLTVDKSIAGLLPPHWRESVCGCGLGERHYRYTRDDCGAVSLNHGIHGDRLTTSWIGCGRYSDEQLPAHRTPLGAIKKLDANYPQK